jgi:MFS family permease
MSDMISTQTRAEIEPLVRIDRRAWGVLAVLCGAVFLEGIDVSMLGVALPAIRDELDMSTSALQWIVSAYVLGYGGFVRLGGRAADLSAEVGCWRSGELRASPAPRPYPSPCAAWRMRVSWLLWPMPLSRPPGGSAAPSASRILRRSSGSWPASVP